jgi:hypothetical protein
MPQSPDFQPVNKLKMPVIKSFVICKNPPIHDRRWKLYSEQKWGTLEEK